MRARHVLVACLLAFAAACSNDSMRDQLSGRQFLLQNVGGYTPVAGTTVRVSFTKTEFSFSAGCNGHSGTYALADDTLLIKEMGSTDMGCTEDRMAQDDWLREFFSSRPQLALDRNTLTVTGNQATLVFVDREVADPDRPLVGPLWTIDTFRMGGAAMATSQLEPTLSFAADGTWRVDTGCNTGSGNYSAGTTQLTLQNVAFTVDTCSAQNTTSLVDLVAAVLANGTASYAIDAARLTIDRDTQGIAAVADR